LRYVPVAALHDGHSYLVENYQNVVITIASRDHLKDPVSQNWHALGLGVSKTQIVDDVAFRPLPGVRDELSRIISERGSGAAHKGILPGKVLLDDDFTAEAMKSALRLEGNQQPYPVVHIASHFSFRPGDETRSFLLVGKGPALTLAQLKTMSQIFSGVQLLTLSACNTATGSQPGEGKEIEGFAVLAQRQGAEAIIATLWSVNDESTSELMQRFYCLHDPPAPMSKAEALRQAQLSLLRGPMKRAGKESKSCDVQGASGIGPADHSFSHPYYWAPFILIGNWK
jgi:CHAT domain-containing protein